MNERIKELESKSWIRHDGYTLFNLEKFAELMIGEFQNILRDNSGEDTGTLSYRVEDHFRS